MSQNQSESNKIQDTAVSALAAASKTPFLTAFKVTLGIGAARVVLALATLAILGTIVCTVGYFISTLK